MNIIKLQDMLRSVPDSALINYVQNPQGEVPSYLALSELQRRKEVRDNYQAVKPEEKSVAEDLTQKAQPQGGLAMLAKNPDLSPGAPSAQGVASLPVDEGMYQEQNFAGGGIIAFDDGGEVQRYASKGLVNLAPDYSVPEKPGFMQRFFGSSSKELLEQERQRLLNKIKNPMNPYNDLDYQQLQEVEAKLAGKTQPGGAMTVKEGQAIQKKYETELLKPKNETPPPPAKEETPKQEKPVNPYDIGMGFKPRPEDDAEVKMERFNKLYGKDPAQDRLTERLAKMEQRAAKEEAESPWMAIARAGFKTMSGTSPFALTNIGAGAAEGLDYYAAAKDRLSKMEEKRMDIDAKLAEAERAKKLAAVQYGVGSEEYAKKANDEYRLKEMQSRYEVKKYEELNPYKMYGQVAEIQAKREEARAKYLKDPKYRAASTFADRTITKDMDAETQQKIKDARTTMKELERKLDAQFPVPVLPGASPVSTNPVMKYDPALRKVMPF